LVDASQELHHTPWGTAQQFLYCYCVDFPGLGPHSFRRANITSRQQVGGSAIEASKIAGHSDLEMTGEYTFVTAERQNELTRRIQRRLASAAKKAEDHTVSPATPEMPPLAGAKVATPVVQ